MAKRKRFYIRRSTPGSNSYSVWERALKNQDSDRFCKVPQVTLYDAKKCCASLNAGLGAWDWLGNVITWDSHYSVVALRSKGNGL